MGKASKCFSSFLTGKREKESQPTLIPLPSTKEKKRWSFRRSAANGKELSAIERSASAPCTRNEVSECEIERTRHAVAVAVATAAAADAAMAAAQQAAAVVKLRAVSNGGRSCRVLEEVAAVKIQAYFRSYLARKALWALKGLVKLQALIRGRLVRKQAAEMLRHLQALVTAQARARAQRIKTAEEVQAISQSQPNNRRSPQHPRYQQSYYMEKNAEESLKIIEKDLCEPRISSKSRSSYSIPQSERNDYRHFIYYCGSQTPSKADIQLQYSPSPSAITDISPRACSNHFEEFFFATTQNSPPYFSPISMSDSTRGSIDYSFPNYMANTQSSRAKVRSQSAPRQRLDSYERQSSRRRQLVEERNIPRSAKIQRSSSLVGFTDIGYELPRHLKLDRSSASVRESEYGSTSTVRTNTNYCRSLTAYEVYGNMY